MLPSSDHHSDVAVRLADHLRAQAAPGGAFTVNSSWRFTVAASPPSTASKTRLEAASAAPPIVADDDPNQAERSRWNGRERDARGGDHPRPGVRGFSIADIDDLVNLTLKRDEVYNLEILATRNNVTFRELADKVQRFCQLPLGETRLAPAEVVGTRVALIRHLVSDQLEFIGIAKNHLTIRDFDDLTRRILGSDAGMGASEGKPAAWCSATASSPSREKADEFLPWRSRSRGICAATWWKSSFGSTVSTSTRVKNTSRSTTWPGNTR